MSHWIIAALLGPTALAQTPPRPPLIEESRSLFSRRPDMVLRWNEIALDAVRAERTPPPVAARNLAIMHVAVYETVNAIVRTHRSYLVDVQALPGSVPEAAVAAAAHRTLVALYPSRKSALDRALTASFAEVADPVGRDNAVALAHFIADKVLAWRADDQAATLGKHVSRKGPGFWAPTPPFFREPLLPGWGHLPPFGIRPGTQPRPPGPPALASALYAAAFNEVKDLGGKDSLLRTTDQTEIARFWADDLGTATPPGHWNAIAQAVALARGNSLTENARLFALLNISLADAGLLCWVIKFHHEFWRPVTAIRAAGEDGNPDTAADPGWTPLLPTPPFPAYTSGHSTFSGAAATVLARFFGRDDIAFESTSDALPGVRRAFKSFSAAAAEAGKSRIYGGIHWEFDNADGLAMGRALADYVVRRHLTPVR